MDVKLRRRLIRSALAVLWVSLGIFLFVQYRGASLLVDNHDADNPALRAPDSIRVTVNKEKTLEFIRGDREIYQVSNRRVRVLVDLNNGKTPFGARFKLPLKPDMFLLSIPKMLNGVEPFIEEFKTRPETRNDEGEREDIEEALE